jgi:hypothetical protein
MYKFDVLELDENNLSVIKTDVKTVYNIDNAKKLSEWVREELKDIPNTNKEVKPHLSSALKVSNSSHQKDVKNGYLGSYIGLSNSVEKNSVGVTIGSTTMVQGNAKVSLSILKSNFFKLVSAFTSRRLIIKSWKNNKDEYFAPNEEHEQFEQFKYDSLVYSLFNSASNQSSIRQIEYKDKLWDIKNEFFWMSKDQIEELADEKGYNNLYNDARTSADRHVYKLLFGEERIYDRLSDDAKAVLDKATELVERSMEQRQEMANDENHLDSWDAGYAQLKLVWKKYFEEDFKEFRQLYKNLEDRMRPLVYELGFLMK